jgi:hypothetical protein
MTRQKKTRREAGRVPAADVVLLEKERSHPSQSKLKPRQRSVYQNLQQQLKDGDKSAQPAKRKNRLKADPAAVAQQSKQLLDQQGESPSTDSTADESS